MGIENQSAEQIVRLNPPLTGQFNFYLAKRHPEYAGCEIVSIPSNGSIQFLLEAVYFKLFRLAQSSQSPLTGAIQFL